MMESVNILMLREISCVKPITKAQVERPHGLTLARGFLFKTLLHFRSIPSHHIHTTASKFLHNSPTAFIRAIGGKKATTAEVRQMTGKNATLSGQSRLLASNPAKELEASRKAKGQRDARIKYRVQKNRAVRKSLPWLRSRSWARSRFWPRTAPLTEITGLKMPSTPSETSSNDLQINHRARMSRVWQPATEQSAHLSPEKWALLFHTFLWPDARHTRADRKRTDAPKLRTWLIIYPLTWHEPASRPNQTLGRTRPAVCSRRELGCAVSAVCARGQTRAGSGIRAE